jgi:Mg/Co/Ni transporter MgtE
LSREIEAQRTKYKIVTNWNRKLAGVIKQQLLIVLENFKYQKRAVGLNEEISESDMEDARN